MTERKTFVRTGLSKTINAKKRLLHFSVEPTKIIWRPATNVNVWHENKPTRGSSKRRLQSILPPPTWTALPEGYWVTRRPVALDADRNKAIGRRRRGMRKRRGSLSAETRRVQGDWWHMWRGNSGRWGRGDRGWSLLWSALRNTRRTGYAFESRLRQQRRLPTQRAASINRRHKFQYFTGPLASRRQRRAAEVKNDNVDINEYMEAPFQNQWDRMWRNRKRTKWFDLFYHKWF